MREASSPVVDGLGELRLDFPMALVDDIRAMAGRGGGIGILQTNPFLGSKDRKTLDDLLNDGDHEVRVADIEHVGIGSDREHRTICDELRGRSCTAEQTDWILGGNFHWLLLETIG